MLIDYIKAAMKRGRCEVSSTSGRVNLNIISLLVIIVLAFATIYSIREYRAYTNRHLSKAVALMKLGEYDEARSEFKTHLVRYPDDIQATLKYGNLLFAMKDYETLIKAFTQSFTENTADSIKSIVISSLRDAYTSLADQYKDSSEKAFEANDFVNARRLWDSEYDLRRKLRFYPDESDTSEVWKRVQRRILLDDLKDIKVKIALTFWAERKKDKYEEVLREFGSGLLLGGPDERAKFVNDKWRGFAFSLIDTALARFENERYQQARDVFGDVESACIRGGLSVSSPVVLEARYNIALTFWNEGQYSEAASILRQVLAANPDYRREKINDLLASAKKKIELKRKLSKWDAAYKKFKDAGELFEAKTYDLARSGYREAIRLYLDAGYENENPIICELFYNIAVAYMNDRMYREAYDTFVSIAQINPNYEPELISEKINKCRDVIQLLK